MAWGPVENVRSLPEHSSRAFVTQPGPRRGSGRLNATTKKLSQFMVFGIKATWFVTNVVETCLAGFVRNDSLRMPCIHEVFNFTRFRSNNGIQLRRMMNSGSHFRAAMRPAHTRRFPAGRKSRQLYRKSSTLRAPWRMRISSIPSATGR